MIRALVVAFHLAPLALAAPAAEPAWRLVHCVATEHGFAVSFLAGKATQRRLAMTPQGLTFGGTVKGQVPLHQVKALRLSPELQVVYTDPASPPLLFGPLTPACRAVVRERAGSLVKVVDGSA